MSVGIGTGGGRRGRWGFEEERKRIEKRIDWTGDSEMKITIITIVSGTYFINPMSRS